MCQRLIRFAHPPPRSRLGQSSITRCLSDKEGAFVDITLGSDIRQFGLLFFNETERTILETLGLLFEWLSIDDISGVEFFR